MKAFVLLWALLALPGFAVSQTLTLLAEDGAGLWGQADGTGAGNDIVRAAFASQGITVKLEVVPYNRAKALLLSGRAFGCFGMSWSSELEGKVVFPQEAIHNTLTLVFVRKAQAAKYRQLSDLPAKSIVGTTLGYEYAPAYYDAVKAGKLVPETAPSLKKLAGGRFDFAVAAIDDLKSAEFLLKEAGVADTVQVGFSLGKFGTYLGLAQNDPATPAALKAFDAGIVALRANGTLDKILATWKKKL